MMAQVNRAVAKSIDTAVTFLRWFGIIALLGVLLSGVTFIQADEVGLVLRFGQLVGETSAEQIHQPGLLLVFPYLIDEVIRVPVSRIQEVSVDSLYTEGFRIGDMTLPGRGYAMTGDDNIIILRAQVKYMVIDPVNYALAFEKPESIIENISTAVLTQTIAGIHVDYVLAEGRDELGFNVHQKIQARADQLELGIRVTAVEFLAIEPPREVRPEFSLVTNAFVNKETRLRDAQSYRESEVPSAQAERDRLIREAEAYRLARLSSTREEVAQFYGVLEEYRRQPLIVSQRLFYEKVESMLNNVEHKIIFPSGDAKRRIIFPNDWGMMR